MIKILKNIAFALLVISIFSITVSAFDDMPNDWSTPALQSAVDNGLLTGDGNLLKPRESLTRAQMAAITARAFGATVEGDISSFTDIPENAWYRSDMAKAYQMNVFRGDGAGHMNPNNAVTREEAFTVLARALCLDENASDKALESFSDNALVSSWAKGAVASMVEKGYVNGSNGKLNPRGNITRAEFAQVMYNLISLYIDDEADLEKISEANGNVVLRSGVTLIDGRSVQRDLIIADGMSGKVTLKNVNVGSRIVVRGSVDLTYSGYCSEIASAVSTAALTLENGAEVEKLTLPDGMTVTDNSKPSTPSTPSNPTTPSTPSKPETEEDIWTEFH